MREQNIWILSFYTIWVVGGLVYYSLYANARNVTKGKSSSTVDKIMFFIGGPFIWCIVIIDFIFKRILYKLDPVNIAIMENNKDKS